MLPVVMYLAMFVPQLGAAVRIRRLPYRKPWTIAGGLVQRSIILALSFAVLLAAVVEGSLPLVVVLVLLTLNQLAAGLTSPAWFEFLVKTTETTDRGILMGWRNSAGAILAFVNSLLLTWFPDPYNYSAVFAAAFAYQMASLLVQKRVEVSHASPPAAADAHLGSLHHAISELWKDKRFLRFLVSAGFITGCI